LGELVSEIRAWRGDDPVVSIYARVFNKDTVIDLPWDEKAREEYLKEMTWRYQHKVPPGYKDARKEDGGIGDFLIWKSLLSLGANKKMDLAFVTGEQKSDWFVRGDGGPVYPRHELVDEYRRASDGKSLRLMSLNEGS
jgi:PIN like domain